MPLVGEGKGQPRRAQQETHCLGGIVEEMREIDNVRMYRQEIKVKAQR